MRREPDYLVDVLWAWTRTLLARALFVAGWTVGALLDWLATRLRRLLKMEDDSWG
jgi:hypothetical protein